MGELSLVIFSVAMQMAVGLFFWMAVTKSRQKEFNLKTPALAALILTAVAMLASLGHLGTPLRAFNALMNLGSSWLSREIILVGAFLIVAAAALHFEHRGAEEGTKKACYWLGTVVGFCGIISMAMVYMRTVIPAWGTWYTMADFLLTSLILGGSLLLVLAKADENTMAKVTGIPYGIMALVLLYAALSIPYMAGLSAGGGAAAASANLMVGKYQLLLIAKWLLVFVGAMLGLYAQREQDKASSYLSWALAALAVGVIAGRYLFYATGIGITIGLM